MQLPESLRDNAVLVARLDDIGIRLDEELARKGAYLVLFYADLGVEAAAPPLPSLVARILSCLWRPRRGGAAAPLALLLRETLKIAFEMRSAIGMYVSDFYDEIESSGLVLDASELEQIEVYLSARTSERCTHATESVARAYESTHIVFSAAQRTLGDLEAGVTIRKDR